MSVWATWSFLPTWRLHFKQEPLEGRAEGQRGLTPDSEDPSSDPDAAPSVAFPGSLSLHGQYTEWPDEDDLWTCNNLATQCISYVI